MKRVIMMAGAAIVLALVMASTSSVLNAQAVRRLSAEFVFNDELSTGLKAQDEGKNGVLIYTKTVLVPLRTVWVTITATGDGHLGNAHLLTCRIDGELCVKAGAPSSPFTGWVNVQRHAGEDDFHDNVITYRWCAAVRPNQRHTVRLHLGSSGDDTSDNVYIEDAHVYIDNASTPCRTWSRPPNKRQAADRSQSLTASADAARHRRAAFARSPRNLPRIWRSNTSLS